MQSSTAQTLPTGLSSPLHKLPFRLQIRFVGNEKQKGVVNILTALQVEQSDVRLPLGVIDFALLQNIQIGSGACQASSSMGTRVLSWGQSGQDDKLTTDLHLAPSLRMSATKLLHSPQPHGVVWENIDVSLSQAERPVGHCLRQI